MSEPSEIPDPPRTAEAVVIGAGAVGASCAFWLTHLGLRPLVVERDPSFAACATALSAASIRQQFSQGVNVEISRFGIDFVRRFAEWTGEAIDLGLRENGYLICAAAAGLADLERRAAGQRAHGAATEVLRPDDLAARFPWLATHDLGGASFGPRDEGWFDAMGLARGLLAAARRQGARVRHDEVTGIERDGGRVCGVRLASGARIACRAVVNAAGARARAVAALAGAALPVEPRKRHVFVFSCPEPPSPPMPLVTDPSGLWVRPEGAGFIAGAASEPDLACDPDDFATDHERWEDFLWPALAHRIPAFERTRVTGFWTGHYAVNPLDHNAIVGEHPDVPGLYLANGFSGHGLQQAPAVGRGVAELIAGGRFATLDLAPLGPERLFSGKALREAAVI